jgi:hypothetical protein
VRRAPVPLTVGLLAAALLVASCGALGSDDDTASGGSTAATTTVASARPTAPTTQGGAAPGGDLRLVSLDINSGDSCPETSDHCQAPDRVDYLVDLVTRAKCPQVVALQDAAPWIKTLLDGHLATWCNAQYTLLGDADAPDRALVVTSLNATEHEQVTLAGGARTALWTRLEDGNGGRIELVVTRTGAGGDALGVGADPCGTGPQTTCPSPCSATGTVLDCQIVQIGALVQKHRDPKSSLVVVAADLGLSHEALALAHTFWNKGWRDSYLDAGNQECDPKFNTGCTSGRASTGAALLAALGSYQAVETARTDYVLLSPSLACSPRFDKASDTDADGVGTGLFANRGSEDFGRYNGMVWPSDHIGLSIDVSCI